MKKFKLAKGWKEEDKLHLLHGAVPLNDFVENGTPFILESGRGIRVKDIYGRESIDAVSGAVCANLGYGRKDLAEAAKEQMEKLSYCISCAGWTSTAAIEYARALAEFTPKPLGRFFFTNSGAEAVETAIKIGRFFWATKGFKEKNKVISRNSSYHGLDLFSMWVTGFPILHYKVGSPNPDIINIADCHCYRCPFHKDYPGCHLECAEALAEAIEKEGKDHVAAFIVEPIYGVAGSICPPPEYLPKIREICSKNDVLLIIDEVMTGFGRTGRNFACEHWGILPDMMCMSKGMIGSALPMGGVALKEEIFQGMVSSDFFPHLYTCGSHPVACAVALKNLEILIENNLVENSAVMGKYMLDELNKLQEYPLIGQVQGMGLMLGLELVKDKRTREPFPEKPFPEPGVKLQLVHAIYDEGVIVRPGFLGDRIQIAPPLIVTKEEVDEILIAIRKAVANFKL